MSLFSVFSNGVLFIVCLWILAGSLFLTVKTRWIQLRSIPALFRMVKQSFLYRGQEQVGVSPHRALLTAMSTTLGISSIVGPIVAIHFGGPGALIGFLFTAFFGSASTYIEVKLSVQHRSSIDSGTFLGGAMHYIAPLLSVKAARLYAICCLVLMTAWSGGQANQLAAILSSPLLGSYSIAPWWTGGVFAVLVMMTLLGGIRRISALSAKIVPCMFVIYLLSAFWILFANMDRWGEAVHLIFCSMWTPYSFASGSIVGGVISALRWGVFKGMQACEAGVGTQSFPHAAAGTTSAESQAILSMLSTYVAGFVAFLSGCIVLVTGTWLDATLPVGISMVAASFSQYFSCFGIAIVACIVILFSFGTSIGNSYNGMQCFRYLSSSKKLYIYILLTGCSLFLGALADVKIFWSAMDVILAVTAGLHMTALVISMRQTSTQQVS